MSSVNQQIADKARHAMQLAQQNKPLDAKNILEDLHKGHPEDEEICCMLGIVNVQLKDYSKSEYFFKKLIVINDSSILGHFYLGEIYSSQGDLNQAIESYIKAGQLAPDGPQKASIYYKAGVIYQKLNMIDDALVYYQYSLNLEPNNAVAHYNVSIIYHGKGLVSETEASLVNAIRFNPNYFMAYNNFATLLSEQGKHKKAEENYRQALRLKADSLEVKLNLANALHQQNKNTDAIAIYEEIIKDNPDNLTAWEWLGALYKRLKNKPKYVECYKRVLEIDPGNAQVQFHLASTGESDAVAMSAAPEDYVASLFDEYAEKFDKHLVGKLKYKTPEYIFNTVSARLDKQGKKINIFDLGCGTGLCGKLFSDYSNKMIGVDLSPKMLEKAEKYNCYDELIEGDILKTLKNADYSYDLILSADVFVYIGDLSDIFSECYNLLSNNGLFAFSVEKLADGDSYFLQESGRYAHPEKYIVDLAKSADFNIVSIDTVDLREQDEKPVVGYVVLLEKNQ